MQPYKVICNNDIIDRDKIELCKKCSLNTIENALNSSLYAVFACTIYKLERLSLSFTFWK